MSVQIEAKYLKYEPEADVLHLYFNLNLRVMSESEVNVPQTLRVRVGDVSWTVRVEAFAPLSPRLIVIPKLHYDVYLHECGIETACSQVSQNSIYHGEFNWLEVSCPSSSCDQEVKLPINLNKELISRLVSIVKDNKRPAFQVVLSTDPYAFEIPYVPALASLPTANVAKILYLNMPVRIKGNLGNLIVLYSDDVKRVLDKIKYVERVKIEVGVKLPETTEGLPEPLIDAIKALKAAFDDINNLDFASAIIKCRGAIERVTTKREEKGGEDGKVIKDEVKGAILNRYEDGSAAKEFYTDFLKILEGTIRDIYEMASKFMHPGSNKAKFNPRMADAIYICRQTLGFIDYLVELSRA
jgi:hypothetical protein